MSKKLFITSEFIIGQYCFYIYLINIPIKTKLFKDNWDLSTARANSIVRILTIDYGFDPIRITASGRSQFHPLESNDKLEARANNRLTEIILSPNMKDLYNLIYQ